MTESALQPSPAFAQRAIALARETFDIEAAAVLGLKQRVGASFAQAVSMVLAIQGRVVVMGMGKSGHIGRKIAATLASTGTPAMFVHPAEASHGDLGMITAGDLVLAISNSGESQEMAAVLPVLKRLGTPVVAMTGNAHSTMAQHADLWLDTTVDKEACPLNLAPTASTTAQLALGDALAVALMERKGFSADQYRDLHPGGSLGRALIRVSDLMHGISEIPLASEDASMREVLLVMAERRFGCVGLIDAQGGLTGIITDGDLSRHIDGDGFLARKASAVMTRNPKIAAPGQLAAEALAFMNEHKITRLFVLEAGARKPVGILHIHDCLRAGIA